MSSTCFPNIPPHPSGVKKHYHSKMMTLHHQVCQLIKTKLQHHHPPSKFLAPRRIKIATNVTRESSDKDKDIRLVLFLNIET